MYAALLGTGVVGGRRSVRLLGRRRQLSGIAGAAGGVRLGGMAWPGRCDGRNLGRCAATLTPRICVCILAKRSPSKAPGVAGDALAATSLQVLSQRGDVGEEFFSVDWPIHPSALSPVSNNPAHSDCFASASLSAQLHLPPPPQRVLCSRPSRSGAQVFDSRRAPRPRRPGGAPVPRSQCQPDQLLHGLHLLARGRHPPGRRATAGEPAGRELPAFSGASPAQVGLGVWIVGGHRGMRGRVMSVPCLALHAGPLLLTGPAWRRDGIPWPCSSTFVVERTRRRWSRR